MIPEAASMFGPTSCPLDDSRHEVYSVESPRRVTYCRKCGQEWITK